MSSVQSVKADSPEGEADYERLVKIGDKIQAEKIWEEGRTTESKTELSALQDRLNRLQQNVENKEKT